MHDQSNGKRALKTILKLYFSMKYIMYPEGVSLFSVCDFISYNEENNTSTRYYFQFDSRPYFHPPTSICDLSGKRLWRIVLHVIQIRWLRKLSNAVSSLDR